MTKDGEFNSDDLKEYCARHGIHKTTTAGYDPNANASAETSVGILKRRARYLLSGCRLPTTWWAVATLAAAQLCRADAGLEEYPKIPFGTRVMLVKDPKPRNAFVPRAEPATVFGPSASVPTGYWTYQRGLVKCRTNLQTQGLKQEELTWVKINMSSWDTPDAPNASTRTCSLRCKKHCSSKVSRRSSNPKCSNMSGVHCNTT